MRYTVKEFFASLVCVALLAFGQTTIFAQTAAPAATSCPPGTTLVQGYTKKNGTAVAAHCKKSRKGTMSGAMSGASPAPATSAAPAVAAPAVPAPAATPAPAMMTKGTSTNGTRGTAADAGATPCPEGKTYVHGYTTKKGETVKGYCRKVRAK
jgi:hypothetical protein